MEFAPLPSKQTDMPTSTRCKNGYHQRSNTFFISLSEIPELRHHLWARVVQQRDFQAYSIYCTHFDAICSHWLFPRSEQVQPPASFIFRACENTATVIQFLFTHMSNRGFVSNMCVKLNESYQYSILIDWSATGVWCHADCPLSMFPSILWSPITDMVSFPPTGWTVCFIFHWSVSVAWPSSPSDPFVLLFQTTAVY